VTIDSNEFSPGEGKSRLHELFEAAKAKDEFEFACTLLRVRGVEGAGWDPFGETHQLVEDLISIINAPLVPHTKVRLGLLLYSHLTEVGATHDMLANLTRVIAGERYIIDPFLDRYPRNRKGEPQFFSTPGKVRALREMLDSVNHSPVVETLDWFFHVSVRNTSRPLSAASGAAQRETRSNSLRTPSAAYTASARRPGTRPRRTRRRSGPFTRPPPTGPSDTTPVFKGVG